MEIFIIVGLILFNGLLSMAEMSVVSSRKSKLELEAKSTGAVMKLSGIKEDEESKVTEEEVKAVMRESLDDGEIDEVEHDIVERVFNLGDRNVSSIMTHRKEVVFLDIDEGVEQLRMKVRENVFNTYPVISGEPDNIVGVVHLKDIFGSVDSEGFTLKDILKEVFYLPKEMCVYDALEKFKSGRMKSAIVTDEYGGVIGIVTLKDILEALVGAMPEENDANDWVTREDGSVLLDGQFSFYDFLERFDKEHLFQENDFNTVSGLVIDLLNEIPHVGQKVSWDEFTFEIMDMDGARVDKILVCRSAVGDEEE